MSTLKYAYYQFKKETEYPVLKIVLASFLFCLFCIGAAIYAGFFIRLNDFWGIYKLSQLLNYNDPTTWLNGAFPIFGILQLRLLGDYYVIFASILLSSISGGVIILICLFRVDDNPKNNWIYYTPLTLLFHTTFLKYCTIAGPYMVSVALCLMGIVLWVFYKRLFTASILIGLACLFRYDMIFVFGALFLAQLIQRNKKALLLLSIGFLLAYSPQLIVDVMSGNLPFTTFHEIPVTFLDWQHYELKNNALMSTVFTYPLKFGLLLLKNTWNLKWYYVIAAAGFLLKTNKKSNELLTISFVMILYSVATSCFNTTRSPLLLLPLTVICVHLLLTNQVLLIPRISSFHKKGILFISLLFIGINIFSFLNKIIEERKLLKDYEEVEAYFLKEKIYPNQVISNSLRFYFPDTPPFRIFRPGGWLHTIPWINEAGLKKMNLNSLDEIIDDCKERQIKCVLFELGSSLYAIDMGSLIKSPRLIHTKSFMQFEVYQILE